MTNCIVPTFADAPELETILVEVPYPFGPSGAKGVGEIPMDGPAAAVANAVEDALGVAFDELPISPEAIAASRPRLGGVVKLTIEVNGAPRTVDASPWKRLLDVLREDLRLTGTKEGCGEGECGACTVMLDGEVVNSCLVAAGQCDGRRVTTVEGLARGERAARGAARSWSRAAARSAASARPGIAVCAAHLVDRGLVRGLDGPAARGEAAARAQVRELLAGNICRCTGYQLIVDAVIARRAREVASAAPEGARWTP